MTWAAIIVCGSIVTGAASAQPGATPSDLPSAERIRGLAAEVVARPEFQLESAGSQREWLLRLLWDWVVWLFKPILRAIERLWIVSPLLAVLTIIALVLALIALLVHVGYTFARAISAGRDLTLGIDGDVILRDPADFERQAQEAVARQDYILAVRYLFRACLLRLEQADRRPFRPGITNRECLHRYRGTSIHDALALLVETIDAKWYGHDACELADYENCRQAHARIRAAEQEIAHAYGA